MKKTLILILAIILVISCTLLVACNGNVTGIEFKNDTVPSEVIRGTTIDYSAIKIVVTMENGNETELSLTDKNVSYAPIDVSTTGAKTLTVNYGGKSKQTVINVVEGDVDDYTVTGFENTDGYNSYIEAKKDKTNKDEEFYYRDAPYTVGYNNGYVFIPKTTAILDANSDAVINSKVKTTYKLSLKNGATYTELTSADLNTYVSKVENNVYYFTEAADGKMFKLDVTLADTYETILDASKKTITQEFKVVEGYNAYDALGLSVLDNLNNKSWESIKQTKLAWDNGKALSEFTNVSKVIIHNNITVKKENLPANYFWTEGEAALNGDNISYQDAYGMSPTKLKNLLKGSLKEVYLGEDWEGGGRNDQRGLFVNDGISLYGNYLTLSYEAGYVEDKGSGAVTAPNGGIYVVNDFNQEAGDENKKEYPEGHWNFIAYRCKTDESKTNTATIENVYFTGKTQKTENTNVPCGLGMVSSELGKLEVKNTIGNQWYYNFNIDDNTASLKLDGGKFFDSFSQMIYSWYCKGMEVTNTTLKRSGGPLIILQTPSYAGGSSGALDGWANAVNFKIDSTNNLENWLTGEEVWFKINAKGADAAIEQMFSLAGLMNGAPVNSNYVKKVQGSDGEDITMYNAIMLLIPAPGDIFDNQKHLAGSITIGDNVYSMDDPILNIRDTVQEFATLATLLKDNFGSQESFEPYAGQIDTLIYIANGLVGGLTPGGPAADENMLKLLLAPLYKSGNNYAYTDTEILFPVPALVRALSNFSNGAKLAVSILTGELENLKAYIAQIEEAGGDASQYKEMAGLMTNLISRLQNWIAKAKPLTDLAEGLEVASQDKSVQNAVDEQIKQRWAQSWATNSEDYVALWINPGGLGSPDFKINYFMLVFAENPAATPAA